MKQELQAFDFDLEYVKEEENVAAFSRLVNELKNRSKKVEEYEVPASTVRSMQSYIGQISFLK